MRSRAANLTPCRWNCACPLPAPCPSLFPAPSPLDVILSHRLPPSLSLALSAGGFEQSHYALAAANASVYAGDPYHLNASGLVGDGNPGYWHMRYYVAVSKAHADIFRSVFGAGSVGKGARVRPVYAWQCGGGHEVGLAYLLQVYGEPAQTFHSMACAPYATIGDAANSPSLTTEQVLDGWRSYQQNISLAGPWGLGSVNYVAGMACTAAYYGLDFVSYESGPDTVQGLDAGQPLWAKGNASADARIEPIVFDYLQSWHAYGQFMGPQNYYTLGAGPLDDRYGIYSVLQDMQHPDTPKLAAIDRARASAVAVSPLIPALPAALNASFFAGHPTPATPNGFNGWPADVYYLVQAAAPLRVVVTLSAGSDDSSAATMAIGLGGVARNEQNVTCESSGNWASYRNCSASAPFDVPAGVSVFRVSRGRPWLGMVYIE